MDAVLLNSDFATAVALRPRFVAEFYERLFADAPELRALFPSSMEEQERRLGEALAAAMDHVALTADEVIDLAAWSRGRAGLSPRAVPDRASADQTATLNGEWLQANLAAIGSRHASYGPELSDGQRGPVTSEMFDKVGAALLATLQAAVPEWDDLHRTAWLEAFTAIKGLMLSGYPQSLRI